MDFDELENISEVAETGSFSRAAENLFTTQNNLMNAVSKLEREEGIKIFDRTSNPITVTYEGKYYIDAAKKILELNKQLKNDMAEISRIRRGKITIGIAPARAAFMLPKFLPKYSELYPEIKINTVEHNSRQLREDVKKGAVDFAILPLLTGFEDFANIKLCEEELFIIARKNFLPENSHDENIIKFEALKNFPFILLKNGHGMRKELDILFKHYGYKPKILMETTNNETALGLCSEGMGLAVVPSMTIEPLKNNLQIDIYKISDSGMKWDVCAIFRKNQTLTIQARNCIELIKNYDWTCDLI